MNLDKIIEEWNAANPVGTSVTYYPMCSASGNLHGKAFVTKTRSQASAHYGLAVIFLEGKSGFVSLAHVLVTK